MISSPFPVQKKLGQPHVRVATENNGWQGVPVECAGQTPPSLPGNEYGIERPCAAWKEQTQIRPDINRQNYRWVSGRPWNDGSRDCLVKQKSGFASASIAGMIVAVRLVVGQSGESRRVGVVNAHQRWHVVTS